MIDVVETGAPGSLLERLRERAAAVQREQVVDVDVGGVWGDLLVARYRPPPLDEVERQAEHVGTSSEFSVAIDLAVRCNVGMLARDDGRLEPLADDDGPVRLSGRLLRLLGIDVPVDDEHLTAREVLHYLYGGNGTAVAVHLTDVMQRLGAAEAGPFSQTNGSTSSPAPLSSASPPSTS